jgi:hypothetical protein
MAKKPAKTKKASNHEPIPWLKLKKMWEAGESYQSMAKATDTHYDPKKADPTKPTRAKISKARNKGVRIDGKLVKFGARGKKAINVKKQAKPTKKAGTGAKKMNPVAKPAAKPATPVKASKAPEPTGTPNA